MVVFIHTSSNYSAARKTGSFAYWISFTGGRISKCGLLHAVQNGKDCQLMAVIKGLEAIYASRYKVSRISVFQQHLSLETRLLGCDIFKKIKEKWPGVVVDFIKSDIAHAICRSMARKVLRQDHNH